MTLSAAEAAREFLEREREFRLGELVTESFHPATAALGETARSDLPAAIRMLLAVDHDVPPAAERAFGAPEFGELVGAMGAALRAGGRVVLSGCGSTGRLAVLIEAAWRRFWQAAAGDGRLASPAESLRDGVLSIMTGGDYALVQSVEGFEDYQAVGRRQAREAGVGRGDVLVAVTEGGETSSVIGTAWEAREAGARVFFVFNNPAQLLRRCVRRSRDVIDAPDIAKLDLTTGPMAVCGSTRMQATTVGLLVIGAALERALAGLLAEAAPADCVARWRAEVREPAAYVALFRRVLAGLETDEAVGALARAARLEAEAYRRGGLVTYAAGAFMADVLTDTTERSPTFALPPFRKCDDAASPPSWAFLKNPLLPTPRAWRDALGREPRGLDWGPETCGALGVAAAPKLDRDEILKFRIGSEDDASRCDSPCSALVLVDADDAWPGHAEGAAGLARAFERMAPRYGRAAALRLGERARPVEAGEVFDVRVPLAPSPLRLAAHLALKLALNAVSTATMAAMGRVRGNAMIFAEATNKKLIDRGTRMVARFTGLTYERACMELHETIRRLREARAAGRAPGSPVAATIERLTASV